MEIHFYAAPSNVPVETGSAIVRTPADWDALPKHTDFPDFAERQNRLQGSENARAAEKKAAKQAAKLGAKPEAQKIDESAVPFAAEKAVLEPLDV